MTLPHPRTTPTRRTLLRGGAAAGAAGLLSGCVTAGGSDDAESASGDVTDDNPLGVPEDADLEVVMFNGGYGQAYTEHAAEVYEARHPDAAVDHQGVQRVGETLQPRFVAGEPPDVVDNTGAGRLDIAQLAASGQLHDLAELLDAPSLDDPAVPVRDTLLPGVVEDGTLDGEVVFLNYSSVLWGLWYSTSLFESHGWAYPRTWDDMLALCEEIKQAGIAPWTWQGKYPEYMVDPLQSLAAKVGGMELVKAIDNLEPGAWQQDAMLTAADGIHRLVTGGHIMAGSEALSHTEAQNAWSNGEAAFIPCGSWLEGEQQGVTPEGFDMVMAPVPDLTASDAMPFGALQGSSSESFLVPAQAANPRGGLDYLRCLFSLDVARGFAETAKALPVVRGATDGVEMSTGLASVADAVEAAGEHVFGYKYRTWYAPLAKAVDDATGELLAGRVDPEAWADRIQSAADDVAADDSVTKYER
ncbi:N-acetylglucosamine/diacetylchitobiose ABC transporter substrate-binding protein [Glycomyces sp. TRM65418]|uniref:N-acetylglucosamine/diacetylchitobiose ABC transporter substrate-binding protein n=1 Tax=Glycomyces sp. TRM65418 TaxID=2867006 RepID=UPI001CE5CAFA|nr:N-acetylglucosamine/diacetylchitobiose ABC transporter substrate-binding protein [Glycomyces sp. TRM65418]MCC3765147.1 N-acetylglucosamine/diacetylchitobiose ABC transporter substrate-binding protein [Glycomyces sp. TRM65418]QZD54774.1 N-acetylglucosamine/diacetylchitobiose ABC transporter substrate-binding protein [Glycomyces sp. TRM65418]